MLLSPASYREANHMPTAHLISATIQARDAFLEAMREFEAETGYTDAGDLTAAELAGPGVLERVISTLNADGQHTAPLRRAHWWWCQTDPAQQGTFTYIGRITLLFDPPPRRGHLELAVRPSYRRQGHGHAILTAVLPIAHALGNTHLTMVPRAEQTTARRLIERIGGTLDFEDPIGLAKYTLPDIPSTTSPGLIHA